MKVSETTIPDVRLIEPRCVSDRRGVFCEVYRQDILAQHGLVHGFVQDNQSTSSAIGTIRGLHFQVSPRAQVKIVRVIQGAIVDVAVDLRPTSKDYGHHVAIELSADNGLQLYIPVGFAHGFMTLSRETKVVYKVSDYYSPDHERGILWNDPDLAIDWPLDRIEPTLSPRDQGLPLLRDCPHYF